MIEHPLAKIGHGYGPALLAAVAACAVGVVAASLPSALLVTTAAGLAALTLLLVARYYANGRTVTGVAPAPPGADVSAAESSEAAAVAPARYLYFAGMLTIAQTTVRPLLGLTLSDWLFFAALCIALAGLLMRPREVRLRVPLLLVLGVALFVASGLLSSIEAVQPLESVARVARFGYLTLVWFWLGTLVLTSWSDIRAAMGCWVTSAAIDGLAAILQARGIHVPFLGPVMWSRMTGFTEHVNDLGGAAGVALAPALALAFTARRVAGVVYWCGSMGLVVAALVLSGSVGGMAAGAGAVLVWLVVSSHGVRPVIVVAVALLLALAVVQMQSGLGLPTPLERALAATGRSDGSQYSTIATRVQGYDKAWAQLGGGGWIGVGLDSQSADVGVGVEVHNIFLKAWYEAGWFAAAGMVVIIIGALGYALIAARRAGPGRPRLIALAALAALTAFVALSMGAPVLHQRYGWVAVALAIACFALTRSDTGITADAGGDD